MFGHLNGGALVTLSQLQSPSALPAICRDLSAELFREDVSSTELRRRMQCGLFARANVQLSHLPIASILTSLPGALRWPIPPTVSFLQPAMSDSRKFLVRGEARRPLYVGVDLGGTNVKVGVVDAEGGVLSWISVPTLAADGPAAGAARIAQAVRQAITAAGLQPQDLLGVGLASTGGVDAAAGALVHPVNLPGWHG